MWGLPALLNGTPCGDLLGPPARCPFSPNCFGWEGSPLLNGR